MHLLGQRLFQSDALPIEMAEIQMRNQTGALSIQFETGSNPSPLEVRCVLIRSWFSGLLLLKAMQVFPTGALPSSHISYKQSHTV